MFFGELALTQPQRQGHRGRNSALGARRRMGRRLQTGVREKRPPQGGLMLEQRGEYQQMWQAI